MGDGEMGPSLAQEIGIFKGKRVEAASICCWLPCGVRAALGAFIPRGTRVLQEKSSGCFVRVCSGCQWVLGPAGPPTPDVPALGGLSPGWAQLWADGSGQVTWPSLSPGDSELWGCAEPGRAPLAQSRMGEGLWRELGHPSAPGEGFRGNPCKHSPIRSCTPSSPVLHRALQGRGDGAEHWSCVASPGWREQQKPQGGMH